MNTLFFHPSCVREASDLIPFYERIRTDIPSRGACLVVPALRPLSDALEEMIDAYLSKSSNRYTSAILNLYNQCKLFCEKDTFPKDVLSAIDEVQAFFKSSFTIDKIRLKGHIMGYASTLSAMLVSDLLKKMGVYNRYVDIKPYIAVHSNTSHAVGRLDIEKSTRQIASLKVSKGMVVVSGGSGFDGVHYVTYGLNFKETASLWALGLSSNRLVYYHPKGGMFLIPDTDQFMFFIEKCSYDDALKIFKHNPEFFSPFDLIRLRAQNIGLCIKYAGENSLDIPKEGTSIGNYSDVQNLSDCIAIQKDRIGYLKIEVPENFDIAGVYSIAHRMGGRIIWQQFSEGVAFKVCLHMALGNFKDILEECSKKFTVLESFDEVEILTGIHLKNKNMVENYLYLKKVLDYQNANGTETWILK